MFSKFKHDPWFNAQTAAMLYWLLMLELHAIDAHISYMNHIEVWPESSEWAEQYLHRDRTAAAAQALKTYAGDEEIESARNRWMELSPADRFMLQV